MNKNLFILPLILIGLFGCEEKVADTEPQISQNTTNEENISLKEPPAITLSKETKPILFDYTSTGCPGCGSWGAPTFEQIAAERQSSIVPVAVHIKYGDPMITDISNEIADNRTGQRFTPQLFVNNANGVVLNGGRIDAVGSLNKIENDLITIQNTEPTVAVGVSSVVNENVMSIRYKTKAYTNLDGVYSVSVYLMEDHLLYRQSSGAADPFEHNYVIRASNQGAFGQNLSPENLVSGAESEVTFTIDINEQWNKDNLHTTVIVWKKEGENYVVVNANNNKVY